MESIQLPETQIVIEREIVIGNIKFHVKSVFIGQTNLDDALKNIIVRRMDEHQAA